jgi:hypothetical protein
VRDHRRDLGGRGAASGVEHQQQLDQVLLHRWHQRLHDEDVALAAVRAQLHLQAVVAEPLHVRRRQLDAQHRADLGRQLRVGRAAEENDVAHTGLLRPSGGCVG